MSFKDHFIKKIFTDCNTFLCKWIVQRHSEFIPTVIIHGQFIWVSFGISNLLIDVILSKQSEIYEHDLFADCIIGRDNLVLCSVRSDQGFKWFLIWFITIHTVRSNCGKSSMSLEATRWMYWRTGWCFETEGWSGVAAELPAEVSVMLAAAATASLPPRRAAASLVNNPP